jgi:hypothetical protein
VKAISFAMSLLLFMVGPLYVGVVEGNESQNMEVSVLESFIDESGCNLDDTSQDDVRLNWAYGDESILAGQQRATALGAEGCSTWVNGEGDSNNESELFQLVEVTLQVEARFSSESTDSNQGNSDIAVAGLHLTAQIVPLEDLDESLNLRWYITVDHTPLGEGLAQDLVKHYGWTSSFYHDEGNVTNWSQEISTERLQEDGIPFSADDLWRLEVVILFIDDLNHTIYGADSVQLQSPSNIPDTAGMLPTILIAIAVVVGLIIIIRQDQQREVGLPRLKGTLHQDKKGWYAEIMITAGIRDVTLKGAYADEPWKMGKVPKQQLVVAGTSRNFTVKLRCADETTKEVPTHWKVDVDELGGWVLDLILPISDKT